MADGTATQIMRRPSPCGAPAGHGYVDVSHQATRQPDCLQPPRRRPSPHACGVADDLPDLRHLGRIRYRASIEMADRRLLTATSDRGDPRDRMGSPPTLIRDGAFRVVVRCPRANAKIST